MLRCPIFSVIPMMIILQIPPASATVLEDLISAQSPCAALSLDEGFVSVRIDRLGVVSVPKVVLTLDGDVITLEANGYLECKTSDAALLKGSASANIDINATALLADCSVQSLSIRLYDYGGAYGAVLQALDTPLTDMLETEARSQIIAACATFKSP